MHEKDVPRIIIIIVRMLLMNLKIYVRAMLL
jgi:hypothetical protein